MDEKTAQQDTPEQPAYEAPELKPLGTVRELTRANENSMTAPDD
jgi:hypothetical protein